MDMLQKIPLRVFYRTIDDLIINHQSDAAISRVLYLLQKFPKNLSVYQLLGKALLDKQEFLDANIVFEKILEIDPDDFVSHIGISIISESSGNFEKALESMRRAYELQPTNESLQNEVKRLQESSTGNVPENIRMTRGTLIKMYSRSMLADQAIAEARLGIQERPDQFDYKIHLAKMLNFSGKNIEAVETCMDIIRTLPYSNAALLILYKCLPSTSDLIDSSIYKSRLSELDPYFTFMKSDTNSVDDIPDIAIMVEERNESEKPIEHLGMFIKSTWETSSTDHLKAGSINQNEDWTSIINEAVSSNNIGSPISDANYEVVDLPNDVIDDSDKTIDKPEKGGNSSHFDISAPEVMADNIDESFDVPKEAAIVPEEEVDTLKENIFLHDDDINGQEEAEIIISKADEIPPQGTQVLHEEITAKEILLNKLRSKGSESSSDIEIPDLFLEKNEFDQSENIKDKNEVKPAFEDPASMDFSTNGNISEKSPIDSELEFSPPPKQDFHDWEMDQTQYDFKNQKTATDILDDTQKIKILSDDPEKLILQAFNSIDEGDFHFAKKCFSKLIDINYQLNHIANRMEDVCQENHDQLDLWLILVEIYKKLGLEEKTLSTLVKAQKNLSLN